MPPSPPPRLILASASPRRASLLREAGYEFEIVTPHLQEPPVDSSPLSPVQFAEAMSFYKAAAVADSVGHGTILAADTVVAREGRVFGKPRDAEHARQMLSQLAGTMQEVITGVTLLDAATGRRLIRHDVTRVTMRSMTAAQLETYIASGDWRGKAGAYGIQDSGDVFIASYEGSFSNVVGLPLELLERMLREFRSTTEQRRNSRSHARNGT